jgi:hypothetical protein
LIELNTNSSHTIDLYINKNDVPVAPTGTPTYIVKDIATSVVVKSGTSTQNTDDIGHFYFQLGTDITNTDRRLLVTWSYVLDSVTTTYRQDVIISTPYVSIGEIIEELGLGAEPTDPNYFSYAKLRSAERFARLSIDNYTSRSFGQRQGSQVVYGNGSDTLVFFETMTAFSKIYQDDVLIYDADNNYNALGYTIELTETGQGLRITNSSDNGMTVIPPSATWSSPKTGWANGSRYKVYATMGYAYIPIEVKQAAFLLVSDSLYNDSLWRQKYVSKFDTGQMSVELRDSAFTGTGNLVADNLLDIFKVLAIVVI